MARASKKKITESISQTDTFFGVKQNGETVVYKFNAFTNFLRGLNPTPDIIPPSITEFVDIIVSNYVVNLSWIKSTDDRSSVGYNLQYTLTSDINWKSPISSNEVGLTKSLTLVDGGYKFRIQAFDESGNYSSFSNVLIRTVFVDVESPTIPLNISANAVDDLANITWLASTDNVGVESYELSYALQYDSNWVSEVIVVKPGLSHSVTLYDEDWKFRVRAKDAANNYSNYSAVALLTIIDIEAPSIPLNLIINTSGNVSTLSWLASTDNRSVTGYQLEYALNSDVNWGNKIIVEQSGLTKKLTLANESYKFRVRAFDVVRNYSDYSNNVTATIIVDNEAPTIPLNLQASNLLGVATLGWDVSTDDSGIVSYELYYSLFDDTDWGSNTLVTADTNTKEITLVSNNYKFRVRAIDPTGNRSAFSNIVTLSLNDLTAPSIPLDLISYSKFNTIKATWTKSTDNVMLSNYEVQIKDFNFIGWAGIPFIPSLLNSIKLSKPTGTYILRVRAVDTSGNKSEYSNESLVVVENNILNQGLIYYGQCDGNTALGAEFFELLNNDIDLYINTANYTLRGLVFDIANIVDVLVSVPYLGSPFKDTEHMLKTTHFIAIPISMSMVSSVNSSFSADIFYSDTINRYTQFKTYINGDYYTVFSYVARNPLGENIDIVLR